MDTSLAMHSPSDDPPSDSPPPPPPRVPEPARRLYRSPKGLIGGVAAGLAGYFDLDPVIVRLLFVASLFAGVGPFAYLVCWVVIPRAPEWPPPGYDSRTSKDAKGGVPSSVASGLLIVALAALLGSGLDGIADFLLPAALLGFGVYLLNQKPNPGQEAAPSNQERGDVETGTPVSSLPHETPGLLTPTVLSLLALGLGLALAMKAAGWIAISVSSLAAGGLLIVGIGLFASIWLGRAPGLVATGLALVAVLLGATAMEPWMERFTEKKDRWVNTANGHQVGVKMGEQTQVPHSLSELRTSYHHGVGEFTLDLRHLDLAGETRNIDVHLGIGELKILLPRDLPAEVYGSVGLGDAGGLEDAQLRTPNGAATHQTGKLIVHYHVGIGEGSVRRVH